MYGIEAPEKFFQKNLGGYGLELYHPIQTPQSHQAFSIYNLPLKYVFFIGGWGSCYESSLSKNFPGKILWVMV